MKKNILVYILYLLILTICVANFSFSRYETSVTGTDEARVARAVFDCVPQSATFNGETVSDISNGVAISSAEPGAELIYTFNICNFKDTATNEVHLNYNLQVVFDPSDVPPSELSLPLTYTLVKVGDPDYNQSDWVDMGCTLPQVDTYTLTVNWDKAKDEEKYLDKQQSVKIIMTVEQLDN